MHGFAEECKLGGGGGGGGGGVTHHSFSGWTQK